MLFCVAPFAQPLNIQRAVIAVVVMSLYLCCLKPLITLLASIRFSNLSNLDRITKPSTSSLFNGTMLPMFPYPFPHVRNASSLSSSANNALTQYWKRLIFVFPVKISHRFYFAAGCAFFFTVNYSKNFPFLHAHFPV